MFGLPDPTVLDQDGSDVAVAGLGDVAAGSAGPVEWRDGVRPRADFAIVASATSPE